MSTRLNQITFKRKFNNLKDINLQEEIEMEYDYYPKGLVSLFIRRGIMNVHDLKVCLDKCQTSQYSVRNIGPQRKKMAMELVKKYERESLLQ
ncbi:MAG: hypothetical protein JEZ08_01920 [Clostridiales bacterium]|nr:hypothetical protein [Clostridiales bacterium]